MECIVKAPVSCILSPSFSGPEKESHEKSKSQRDNLPPQDPGERHQIYQRKQSNW